MIFLAKNAIKTTKKPDCWAPSPVVLDHTEISLQAPPLHPLPSKVRSVFSASEVRDACVSLVPGLRFDVPGLDVYYPGAQGSGIRYCCRKLGTFIFGTQ